MLSPSSLILLSVLPLFRNDGEETVVSPVICAETRAPHLSNRCAQPSAGDADVRCSVPRSEDGTSFGVEQIGDLVWSSRSA
jgi:hypothetical protein